MPIEARALSCGYDKARPAQRDLNFSLEPGQICCVLGPNGCGKTTMIKTLLGTLPPLSGRVAVDGEEIGRIPAARRARTMAYVAQTHSQPFPYTVEEVVLMGRVGQKGYLGHPGQQDRALAREALESVGLSHLAGQYYTDISGGELQLVMIARAIVQQPRYLVLDEPTASLDYGNTVRVITKVGELAQQGYGILMTTHSPDHAFLMDSDVLLLQRNAPMRYGPAAQIITEASMREAYGIRVRVVEFADEEGNITRMCAPAIPKNPTARKTPMAAS